MFNAAAAGIVLAALRALTGRHIARAAHKPVARTVVLMGPAVRLAQSARGCATTSFASTSSSGAFLLRARARCCATSARLTVAVVCARLARERVSTTIRLLSGGGNGFFLRETRQAPSHEAIVSGNMLSSRRDCRQGTCATCCVIAAATDLNSSRASLSL